MKKKIINPCYRVQRWNDNLHMWEDVGLPFMYEDLAARFRHSLVHSHANEIYRVLECEDKLHI